MSKCKPKPCSECKEVFQPRNSLTVVCGYKCAGERVKRINAKKAASASKKAERASKRSIRARKTALRSKSWYVRQTQAAFNTYIRKRDFCEVCISCQRIPKKVQAGHFKTTAARPDLRFHPFNCHLQCFHCNVHKSGAIDLYRPNLIKKIGESNVMWLESHQPAQNLTVDDLIDIRDYYKEQAKLI